MGFPDTEPRMPAEYYRREAARVRRLTDEATTPTVKAHLQDIAGEYERLAGGAWEPRSQFTDKPV